MIKMVRDQWLLPEGIEELLPEEAARLEAVRRRLLDLFSSWGYELVIPPMIEFLDSLKVGTGRDIDVQTFKLTDQVSGRMMGVRADMTPQVARIDAHNLKRETPTRLCYFGTVLNARGDQLEKSRSPMQIGAELYGHSGIESDLEIVSLMLRMLEEAGLGELHLDLGHVDIFRGLTARFELDADQEALLFEVLQRKAKPELSDLLDSISLAEDAKRMFLQLPDLNGGVSQLAKAKEVLSAAGDQVLEALAELEKMAGWIESKMPGLPLHIDLAELRGYHYHAGLVFAAFVPGYGREVARGGRYDNIGKHFGRSRAATGFSADLKSIVALVDDVAEAAKIKIFAPGFINDESLEEMIAGLRGDGFIVIRELAGQSAGAAKMGCEKQLKKVDGRWQVVEIQ